MATQIYCRQIAFDDPRDGVIWHVYDETASDCQFALHVDFDRRWRYRNNEGIWWDVDEPIAVRWLKEELGWSLERCAVTKPNYQSEAVRADLENLRAERVL
jgi:hypothetical protein